LLLTQALRWILNPAQLAIAAGLVIFHVALIAQAIVEVVLVSYIVTVAAVLGQVAANRDSLGSVALLLHEGTSATKQAIIP